MVPGFCNLDADCAAERFRTVEDGRLNYASAGCKRRERRERLGARESQIALFHPDHTVFEGESEIGKLCSSAPRYFHKGCEVHEHDSSYAMHLQSITIPQNAIFEYKMIFEIVMQNC